MTALPASPRARRSRVSRWLALLAFVGVGLAALAPSIFASRSSALTERWLATDDPDIRLQLFRPPGPGPSRGFPVLFFNPGWRSSLDGYETHLRILAAEGYVVLGVERAAASMVWQGDLDLSSEAAFAQTLDRADRATRTEAAQMSHLLDGIARRGVETTPLDLDRVGLSGHSFGGTVALQTALVDRRFRVAVNIDGWQFAEAAHDVVPGPVLILTDTAERPASADLMARELVRRNEAMLNARNADWIASQSVRPDAEIVTISNAGHGAYIRKAGWRGLAEEIGVRLGLRQDVAGTSDRALRDFLSRRL